MPTSEKIEVSNISPSPKNASTGIVEPKKDIKNPNNTRTTAKVIENIEVPEVLNIKAIEPKIQKYRAPRLADNNTTGISPKTKANRLKDASMDQFLNSFDTREQGLFFYYWINNGLDHIKAYKSCYPNAHNDKTVSNQASKLLMSIDKRQRMRAWLESKGLNEHLYFDKLLQGINDPDNKTMKLFHDKLGKVLDIEDDKNTQNIAIGGNKIQVNLISYLDDNNNDKGNVTT